MARHVWDDGEMFMGDIISTCAVCDGVRVRQRIAGLDYINTRSISIDLTGKTRKGWRYQDTPRSCPGKQETTQDDID